MHFCFIGLSPSALLKKLLESNGYTIEVVKTLPKTPKAAPDLVAFALASPENLTEVAKVRRAFPKSWVTVVLKKKWFENSDFQSQLITSANYDDVWLDDFWESFLLFSLQSMVRTLKLETEYLRLEDRFKELRTQCDGLSEKSHVMLQQFERDFSLASNIQRSLLPKAEPKLPGIQISSKYVPAEGPGGDYYDIFEFGDKRRMGILMADSKTHGLAASLLSILVKLRLDEMKDRFPDSRSFLEFLNQEIRQIHEGDLAAMELLYGILDRKSLTFQYTVAGRFRPLLHRLGETRELTTSFNPALGGKDHHQFQENFVNLKPGDLLLFYTTGLELPLELKKETPEAHFSELLSNGNTPDLNAIRNEVMGVIQGYKEKEKLRKDVTFIQLWIDPKALYVASESK